MDDPRPSACSRSLHYLCACSRARMSRRVPPLVFTACPKCNAPPTHTGAPTLSLPPRRTRAATTAAAALRENGAPAWCGSSQSAGGTRNRQPLPLAMAHVAIAAGHSLAFPSTLKPSARAVGCPDTCAAVDTEHSRDQALRPVAHAWTHTASSALLSRPSWLPQCTPQGNTKPISNVNPACTWYMKQLGSMAAVAFKAAGTPWLKQSQPQPGRLRAHLG